MLRFCADGNNPGDKKSGIKAEQTTVKSRFYTVNFPYFSKIILSPLPQITNRQPHRPFFGLSVPGPQPTPSFLGGLPLLYFCLEHLSQLF